MIQSLFILLFSLSVLATLIVFILRQKGSFFKSVQMLFITVFICSVMIVLSDSIKNHLVNSESIVYFTISTEISVVVISLIALEHAALMLRKEEKGKVLTSTLYKGYLLFILIVTWVFTPWKPQPARDLWGGLVYTPKFEPLYLIFLSGVFLAFVAYPCRLFIISSRRYEEKAMANALKWIGVSWTGVGFSMFIFHALLRQLGFEWVELQYALSGIFFSIMAHFFKKTSILESLFAMAHPPFRVGEGEHIVTFYTPKIDKMKIFSSYVNEGLLGGDRVVYVYPDEEDNAIRAKLKNYGVNVERHERNGSLRLMTLSQAYLLNGVFDKDRLMKFWMDFKADTKGKGYQHERDLIDLGDLSFIKGEEEKYFEYLKDAQAEIVDTYLMELRAVNTENLSKQILQKFEFLSTKSMDLLQNLDQFSKAIGLNHQEVVGRIILLEFDPASNHEKVVQDFATEATANIEPIAVFTSKGSALHLTLSKQENATFLLLTQSISAPHVNASTNEILLPANDTSLLLNALDKTLKTYPHGNLNVVFDDLSNLVLLLGFEKTYGFLRYTIEMLTLKGTTAIFLSNPHAQDLEVASALRGLFDSQVTYGKRGLQVVKLFKSVLKV